MYCNVFYWKKRRHQTYSMIISSMRHVTLALAKSSLRSVDVTMMETHHVSLEQTEDFRTSSSSPSSAAVLTWQADPTRTTTDWSHHIGRPAIDGSSMHDDDTDNKNWMIQMTLMGSFSVVSGAANLTVMAVILLSVRLRRSPHLYVANALLLALVSSLVSVPLRMMMLSSSSSSSSSSKTDDVHELHQEHAGDHDAQLLKTLCDLSIFAAILSQFGIAYTLLSAALDRYLTVVHGRLGVRRCSGLVYFPIMLSVWGLAFVTALLEVYGHQYPHHDHASAKCHVTSGAATATPSVLSSVTWTFAFVFLACWTASNALYVRTYFYMRHCRRMRPYLGAPLVHDGWSVDQHVTRVQLQHNGGGATGGGVGLNRRPTPPSFGVLVPNPPAMVKRHLFGVTALLNVVCSFLWLPSLVVSCLVRLSPPPPRPTTTTTVIIVIADDDDQLAATGSLGAAIVAWIELLHVLVVPVLYVCSCSTFRKELLKIRNYSYDE